MINRRNLIKTLIATTAASSMPGLTLASMPKHSWKNWSGNQSCSPARKLAPASLEELQTIIRDSQSKIRVAGAGLYGRPPSQAASGAEKSLIRLIKVRTP